MCVKRHACSVSSTPTTRYVQARTRTHTHMCRRSRTRAPPLHSRGRSLPRGLPYRRPHGALAGQEQRQRTPRNVAVAVVRHGFGHAVRVVLCRRLCACACAARTEPIRARVHACMCNSRRDRAPHLFGHGRQAHVQVELRNEALLCTRWHVACARACAAACHAGACKRLARGGQATPAHGHKAGRTAQLQQPAAKSPINQWASACMCKGVQACRARSPPRRRPRSSGARRAAAAAGPRPACASRARAPHPRPARVRMILCLFERAFQ